MQARILLGLPHQVPLPPTPLQLLGVTKARVATVSKELRVDTPSKVLGVPR